MDAVLNHMAGLGRSGQGIAGSSFNSDNHDFPAVPYTVDDFNPRSKCPSTDGEYPLPMQRWAVFLSTANVLRGTTVAMLNADMSWVLADFR